MGKKYLIKKNIESAGFAGSTLQQHMAESIEKGYLIWDISTCTHERRYILNDFGFSKINISKGEDVWQRIDDSIRLSFNPKKTKIYVEIEDDAENENIELKSQIKKYIKTKYKCEIVEVEFKKLLKDKVLGINTDNLDLNSRDVFRQLLEAYIKENNYENIEDVLEFSDEIDASLELKNEPLSYVQWDLNKMVTYNIFSHPAHETVFDFDSMGGILGIFGKNYNGKSNIVRALVWGLYEKLLGGGDKHKVVNLYTGINKAYVHIYFTANGVQFRSKRGIVVSNKKDGSTLAKYTISYDYAEYDESGNIIDWIPEDSDKAAKEKPEIKKLIVNAVGKFENFTKVSLQTQGGKDDYLSLSQQDKNDLFREYMNLGPCDLRYDAANKKFNQVKALQKNLGDPAEIEKSIEDAKKQIEDDTTLITNLEIERKNNFEQIEAHNSEILELTKKLIRIDGNTNLTSDVIQRNIQVEESKIEKLKTQIAELDEWLKTKFQRDIPEELKNKNVNAINKELVDLRNSFTKGKEEFTELQEWINKNNKQIEVDTTTSQDRIDALRQTISRLNDEVIVAKGKKCPTCGNVSKSPNPVLEKECADLIQEYSKEIVTLQTFIKEQREIVNKNNLIDKETNRLEAQKNNLQSLHLQIGQLKLVQQQIENIQTDIIHNNEVMLKTNNLKIYKDEVLEKCKLIEGYNNQLNLIISNQQAINNNNDINVQIKHLTNSLKSYKLVNFQFDEKLKNIFGNIKVQENNVQNYQEKLDRIKEADRVYKKYSIYLQAVSRDGIPAQIIRKKLPMVNYKINNILRSIVNFKMEMFVKTNGDVQEVFYFNDDRSDSLPLSSASGSQKFICTVAIRDALHYISCLVKPSFCIIDEGFDTLDEDKISDIGNVFVYLKNKYKNVILVTHRNQIKDFVEHMVIVTKSQDGLTKEQIDNNPNAGISQFSMK